MKYCIDCKWSRPEMKTPLVWGHGRCVAPQNADEPDIITGEPAWRYATARILREISSQLGGCGKEAAWFVQAGQKK